jgi:hypothetical protein
VLPVQPLTYLPVQMPDGEMALKVMFLRKKTEEKDSRDDGILFHCQLASKDANDDSDLIDDDRQSINLVAKRIANPKYSVKSKSLWHLSKVSVKLRTVKY